MADELARVRSAFVGKANKELINQLLDDLLQDHVLNEGQKDSIVEENRTTADKARSLIDIVKKKGDAASMKLNEHLKKRDPTLHSDLGLSHSQPAPPAAKPQTEQEWSTTLKPTTKEFWNEKQNDTNIYPATKESIGNRVALLITNIKFTDKKFDRNGADKDEENMEKLLTALGYMVVKHTNLTGQAIDEAVIEFSKHPKLKETDSAVVVIMSHGKLGAVLGVNSKLDACGDEQDQFPINNIFKHLGPEKCPALLNKPKIIIIQACRGEEEGSVVIRGGANSAVLSDDVTKSGPSMSAAADDIEDDDLKFAHREKDFISFLSSTPDTVSYRHRDLGSFLIQYIVEVFNTLAHKHDIEKLFKKVMQRFEDFPVPHLRQMPTKDRCTLTKDFYFFPGLLDKIL